LFSDILSFISGSQNCLICVILTLESNLFVFWIRNETGQGKTKADSEDAFNTKG